MEETCLHTGLVHPLTRTTAKHWVVESVSGYAADGVQIGWSCVIEEVQTRRGLLVNDVHGAGDSVLALQA